ncbi:MAG: IS630 family transposase [Candidatus Brocadiaceae bacterium]
MAKRKALELSTCDKEELKRISVSRTEAASAVRRAKILLFYHEGKRITEIARKMDTNRPMVERVIDKAFMLSPLKALKDLPRKGRSPTITDDAKSWVLSIACRKPLDFDYAHETWTYSLLIKHVRKHCKEQGHPCLKLIGKGRLNSILSKSNIKPHKVSYYLEKRDPEFDKKMAQVLCVYKEVELQNISEAPQKEVTVSYDEKPGIQAIKNIAADLLPVPGKYSSLSRDYEYKRLGTVSLLAGIDLHTGNVIPLVRDRHRSKEFIEFLMVLDNTYPKDWKIKLVLDNHTSHTSKETQRYLKTTPNRFEFVFTPKHGSWLNMIEIFFSKISRSFLRRIRVSTKNELVDRIYRGISQINEEPVVFKWRYKMNEITVT